jgi:hypothetical protein
VSARWIDREEKSSAPSEAMKKSTANSKTRRPQRFTKKCGKKTKSRTKQQPVGRSAEAGTGNVSVLDLRLCFFAELGVFELAFSSLPIFHTF